MSTVDDSAGEPAPDRECYRCDRNAAPQFLFRIDVTPPEPLSAKYADSVRHCCEHCVAAMNLSEFLEQVKARARRGSESVDG
ncbi:hypothetical protein C479_06572 [Halovivax asiaticus JCM 14624]|uniref:Uncharacterized protein n=1 Tax=Halovivax asiaticus JCM 14624 TaxID=1227490 RepID=M0BN21_9EURY|nr:hypothetical protein [Halovivax asiaticus]ELZ11698.1 hypothetical protein C479_06572 [Halovivax asiaticus JCM 14624]